MNTYYNTPNPHEMALGVIDGVSSDILMVIWDQGDTLVRLSPQSWQWTASWIGTALGKSVHPEMVEAAVRSEWHARRDAESLKRISNVCTEEQEMQYWTGFFTSVVQLLGVHRPHPDLIVRLGMMQMDPDSFELLPGALENLKRFKRMGIRQALLANGFPSARKILVQKGLLLYFDEVVISCEVGLVKPDQEIYEYLIGRAHVQPKQAVFIDDRDYFVQGANLAGIQGIWFNAHGDKAKEWQGEEISRLDQLATLLGQGAFLAPVAI